jgi:glycosyltransferase involved in cell wall biosynthesis
MQRIKVAILKGRKELEGSSGVDYFTLNLFHELKKNPLIDPELIYGNYILPGMFKFLHFNNLNKFDIIHNCVPGLGIFIRTNKPIITTFYDDIMFNYQNLLQNRSIFNINKTKIIKRLWGLGLATDIKRSQKVVAISEYAKSALVKRFRFKRDNIPVIPPGIRTDIYKPLNKQSIKQKNLRLFYCGRICRRKGIDLLLDALVILKSKYNLNTVKLYVAGSTDKSFNITYEINKRNLVKNVVILGNISTDDVLNNYQSSDVYVFPSKLEGYGLTPIEALACGARVVSTNVPSVADFPEIIKVKPTEVSIAQGIKKAISQKLDYKNAYSKIKEKYSMDYAANEYINIYREIMSI